ncbi:hypothetical protein GCM10020331_008620 [Ectobacillus funiculus]
MISYEKQSRLVKVVIDRVSRLNLLSICEKYLQTDLEHVVLSLYEQYYQDKDIKESFRLLKKRIPLVERSEDGSIALLKTMKRKTKKKKTRN